MRKEMYVDPFYARYGLLSKNDTTFSPLLPYAKIPHLGEEAEAGSDVGVDDHSAEDERSLLRGAVRCVPDEGLEEGDVSFLRDLRVGPAHGFDHCEGRIDIVHVAGGIG